MTDEEVDTQFTVLAIMLAAPFLNGDHGELPEAVRSEIQAITWQYAYIPAQELLIAEGATAAQVERAKVAKKNLFKVSEYIAASPD